jgi:hypothetical protein
MIQMILYPQNVVLFYDYFRCSSNGKRGLRIVASRVGTLNTVYSTLLGVLVEPIWNTVVVVQNWDHSV